MEGTNGATTPMTPMQQRIARAQARTMAATATISAADRQEIADRETLAKHEDAERTARREARLLAVARELDAAKDRLPAAELNFIDLEDARAGAGAYILRDPPHGEVSEWSARMADTADAKTRDRMTRNLAAASLVAWVRQEVHDDGSVTFKIDRDIDKRNLGADLHNVWTQIAPGAATSIVNVATDLAGFVAARRKS